MTTHSQQSPEFPGPRSENPRADDSSTESICVAPDGSLPSSELGLDDLFQKDYLDGLAPERWYLVADKLTVYSGDAARSGCGAIGRKQRKKVVDNISFAAQSGRVLAIVGVDDSGFDALLHAVAGQLPSCAVQGQVSAISPVTKPSGCSSCTPTNFSVNHDDSSRKETYLFSSQEARSPSALNTPGSPASHHSSLKADAQSAVSANDEVRASCLPRTVSGVSAATSIEPSRTYGSFLDNWSTVLTVHESTSVNGDDSIAEDESIPRERSRAARSESELVLPEFSWGFPKYNSLTESGLVYTDDKARRKRYRMDSALLSFIGTRDRHLLPNLTVEETFFYAARLQLPHLTSRVRRELVERMLSRLGLQRCRATRIGNVDHKRISTGERRRVAIGVELLNYHKSFFALDNPTYGLDSVQAENILYLLKETAQKENKCVLFSVSQPSPVVMHHVDDLLLVHQGRIIYHDSVKEFPSFIRTFWEPRADSFDKYLIETALRTLASGTLFLSPDLLLSDASVAHSVSIPTQKDWETRYSQTQDDPPLPQSATVDAPRLGDAPSPTHASSAEPPVGHTVSAESPGLRTARPSPQADATQQVDTAERQAAWLANRFTGWRERHPMPPYSIPPSQSAVASHLSTRKHRSFFFTKIAVLTARLFRNAIRSPLVLAPIVIALLQGLLLGSIMYQYPTEIPRPWNQTSSIVPLLAPHSLASDDVRMTLKELNQTDSSISRLLYKLEHGLDAAGGNIIKESIFDPPTRERTLHYLQCLYNEGGTQRIYGSSFLTTAHVPEDNNSDLGFAFKVLKNVTSNEHIQQDVARYLETLVQGARMLHRTYTQVDWRKIIDTSTKSPTAGLQLIVQTYGLLQLLFKCSGGRYSTIVPQLDLFTDPKDSPWWYVGGNAANARNRSEPLSNGICPHDEVPALPLDRFAADLKKANLFQPPNTPEYIENQKKAHAILLGLLGKMDPSEVALFVLSTPSEAQPTSVVPTVASLVNGVVQSLARVVDLAEKRNVVPYKTGLQMLSGLFDRVKYQFFDTHVTRFFIASWTSLTTTGVVLCLVAALGFGTLMTVFTFQEHRILFNKETANGLYSPLAFFIARILSDVLFHVLTGTLLGGATSLLAGLAQEPNTFEFSIARLMNCILICNVITFTVYGFYYFVSASTPQAETALVVAPFFLLTWLLLAGFVLRDDGQLVFWCRWFRYTSPHRYGYFALMQYYFPLGAVFGDTPNELVRWVMGVPEAEPLWMHLVTLLGLGVAFRVLGFISLTFAYRRQGVVDYGMR